MLEVLATSIRLVPVVARAAALSLFLAACTGGGSGQVASPSDTGAQGSGAGGESPSSLPPPVVDPDEIVPGGPPPDGIPPIDDPEFLAPERPGTFFFRCDLHPKTMTGEFVVTR